jgi:hypothetical protein
MEIYLYASNLTDRNTRTFTTAVFFSTLLEVHRGRQTAVVKTGQIFICEQQIQQLCEQLAVC